MRFGLAAALLQACAPAVAAQNRDKQQHYLVGLLNLPQSNVPDVLKNHTSGTAIPNQDNVMWVSSTEAPFEDVPGVGFSDMEPYYDADGNKVTGEFFCLSDNGFGNSDNSVDYPLNIQHLRIQKPFTFRHAETTFEKYTEAQPLGAALIHDPDNYIKWENGADIQVNYKIPDETWNDWKALRVLTGRDLDVEGMAVLSQTCAVIGDELMPAIFMVNPTSGVVLSPFVRTPDIDSDGSFNGKFLSTRSDKVHCAIADLEAGGCTTVDSAVVDASDYRKHDKTGGYEGFAKLADGTIAAFLEKKSGDTTLSDEPGVRVYHVKPGDCTSGSAPVFDKFIGYYPFEIGGGNIADVSAIPGSTSHVLVIERNGFPSGHLWPGAGNPANNLCVVNLLDLDDNMVMKSKKCILNYHDIDDPWDTDGNGILKYARTQVTNEALVVVDDYCFVAGTDTNFPWTNQFGIDTTVEYYQKVVDARFMVVCFVEPIFNGEHPLLKSLGGSVAESAASGSTSGSAETGETKDEGAAADEAKDEAATDESEADETGGDGAADATQQPPSRALKRQGTDYVREGTLLVGGLVLTVGAFMFVN